MKAWYKGTVEHYLRLAMRSPPAKDSISAEWKNRVVEWLSTLTDEERIFLATRFIHPNKETDWRRLKKLERELATHLHLI